MIPGTEDQIGGLLVACAFGMVILGIVRFIHRRYITAILTTLVATYMVRRGVYRLGQVHHSLMHWSTITENSGLIIVQLWIILFVIVLAVVVEWEDKT